MTRNLWILTACVLLSGVSALGAASDKGKFDLAPVRAISKPAALSMPLVDLNLLWDLKSGHTLAAVATPAGDLTSTKTHKAIAQMYVLGGADLNSNAITGCLAAARTGHLFEQIAWRVGVFGGAANDKKSPWRGGILFGITIQF